MSEVNKEVRPKGPTRTYPMGIRSLLGGKSDEELLRSGNNTQCGDNATVEDGDKK